jgi:hypothetical protein
MLGIFEGKALRRVGVGKVVGNTDGEVLDIMLGEILVCSVGLTLRVIDGKLVGALLG